ncbi:formate dehydrogenase accessory sulfurtransferase FdhD [Steroidobacter sp.]|uniref:formate dehydrogenase accessory sulfurtransferase FdhD n=1 Tax=Steroidobacter sp. TaxID=1978227 RepID=UPI001A44FA63|nr:formate dehydrogenase accessory sulfurtransferase FdhD [Steroidobacter sp.]MBL8268694.1 formate dehydrogenase accessory sulfurtransferase FdhD [Steroidobacter sp.]
MPDNSPPPATSCEVTVQRWRDGDIERVVDQVAEEVPVALTYQGVPHVVMLATPANLEDLAVGFTLSESIVDSAGEIQSVEAVTRDDGALEVRIGIPAAKLSELLRRQRNLTGRTGCGLCGASTVEDAIRHPAPVLGGVSVGVKGLHAALKDLRHRQEINLRTGSVHAAAWVSPESGIQLVREDVGRHNALDKVIGAVVRAGGDFSAGYFVVTSRASYEMVQKAVTVGGTLLAAVSAPTAFAVRMAESAGLTLIGFAREHQHVVYAHPSRLLCTSTT